MSESPETTPLPPLTDAEWDAIRMDPDPIEAARPVPAADEDRERLDPDVEALADLLMDLRMDGPAADGWTYQRTMRHYAERILGRWLAGIRAGVSPSTGDDRLREAAQAVLDAKPLRWNEPGTPSFRAAMNRLAAALSTGAPDTEAQP